MKIFCHLSIYIVVFVTVFTACQNIDDLPDEPIINSVKYDEGTNELIINFTDGDGNFGLTEEMITPPFQDSLEGDINDFYNNLWLDVQVKRNGEFESLDTPNPYGFDFRIPFLTPQGQNKQLRVNIFYRLLDIEDFVTIGELEIGDTLRYDVTLVDRDLNVSNTVTYNDFIIN